MKMRSRIEESANYKSVFINGKTLRFAIDNSKPITELRWPEFYDISGGGFCSGGCKMCYASANTKNSNYKNLAEKIHKFFGSMTLNQRPYQVACGGDGDLTEHEECWEACAAFRELDIIPNITTHGLKINEKTIEKIKQYCGGVAVSLHLHLQKGWERAIQMLSEADVKLNVHFVFSDKENIDMMETLYQKYCVENDMVDYFVLLPRMNVGYAANNPKKVDLKRMTEFADKYHKDGKLAFGANAAQWLFENHTKYNISMYPVEIFSKYLLLDEKFTLFNNSFNRAPVGFEFGKGVELGKVRTDYSLI